MFWVWKNTLLHANLESEAKLFTSLSWVQVYNPPTSLEVSKLFCVFSHGKHESITRVENTAVKRLNSEQDTEHNNNGKTIKGHKQTCFIQKIRNHHSWTLEPSTGQTCQPWEFTQEFNCWKWSRNHNLVNKLQSRSQPVLSCVQIFAFRSVSYIIWLNLQVFALECFII